VLNDVRCFDKYVEEYDGNRYAAVVRVCKDARALMRKYPNSISDKDALMYAASGKKVDKSKLTSKCIYYHSLDSILWDKLSLVSDTDVLKDVKLSIYESVNKKHLIYLYKNTKLDHKKCRVRVLCNIIWQEFVDSNWR